MPQITLPDDAKATVPLVFADAIGSHTHPPAGGTVTSDNPAVATAALSADGGLVEITSVADGVANVAYSNGSLSATLQVTVQAPTPTAVDFDTADATFAPR